VRKPKKPELQRDQWDFSECPDCLLSACLFYEYCRQLALEYRTYLRAAFSRELFAGNFDHFYHKGFRFSFNNPPGVEPLEIKSEAQDRRNIARIICLLHGFPNTPFLDPQEVDRAEFRRFCKLVRWHPPDRSPTLARAHEQPLRILRTPAEMRNAYEEQVGNWRWINPSDFVIDDFCGLKTEMTVLFINWSVKPTRLVAAFKDWVKDNKPKDIQPVETRGSQTTNVRDKLKFLSVLRLLDVLSPSEAIELTEHTLGMPLYQSETEWYKARGRARAIMAELFTPFFIFKDGALSFDQMKAAKTWKTENVDF
jgi:hypothetical protein